MSNDDKQHHLTQVKYKVFYKRTLADLETSAS